MLALCAPASTERLAVDILQALYDSEINCFLASTWDAGVEWRLGDEYNGFVATGNAEDWPQAIAAVARAAMCHYPNSELVRRSGVTFGNGDN